MTPRRSRCYAVTLPDGMVTRALASEAATGEGAGG
jgi:hypothetical protein